MFTVIITPKWIGSMPSLVAIGNRIGAVIRMIDEGSMKLPITSSRMFTAIKKPITPTPECVNHSAMPCGICSLVRIKENNTALVMM